MIRILLADDHQVMRRQLREMLESEPGLTVCAEASDGCEAVTLAASTLPDFGILDLSMPHLNGLQAAQHIRGQFPQIEMIIITMHDPIEFMERVITAGARTCVLKTDLHELVAVIRSIWQQRRIPACTCGLDIPSESPAVEHPSNPLTELELRVVRMLAQGLNDAEIAVGLCLTVKGVKTLRAVIMRKLDASSTFDVVQYAVQKRHIETRSMPK